LKSDSFSTKPLTPTSADAPARRFRSCGRPAILAEGGVDADDDDDALSRRD